MTDRQKAVGEDLAEQIKKESAKNRTMVSHRFYFGFVYDALSHTPLFAHWQAFLSLLRRFRAVAFLLRILGMIFAIVETGTLVLLTTAVFLVILPLAVALIVGIMITALLESRRTNRQLSRWLNGKRIYVLFLSTRENAFLEQNAGRLSEEDGTAVIVVSPYLVSPRGLRNGRFYCTARREADAVYLIRRYYYFSLRKHVLHGKAVAYLY